MTLIHGRFKQLVGMGKVSTSGTQLNQPVNVHVVIKCKQCSTFFKGAIFDQTALTMTLEAGSSFIPQAEWIR